MSNNLISNALRFLAVASASVSLCAADIPAITSLDQWKALIPKDEHGLKEIISGQIDSEYFAVYKSADSRVAVCLYSPYAESMTEIVYDVVDNNGVSLFLSGDVRKKFVSPLERVFVTAHGNEQRESVLPFGVLEKLLNSPARLKLVVRKTIILLPLAGF